jgi:hypothetical protein
MFKTLRQSLLLASILCALAATSFCDQPYNLCNSYIGYACVTPFLLNTDAGTGKGNYGIQVTPDGASSPSTYYTVSSGQSQGYIVLIGRTGSSWLIAPVDSPCTWSPAFQNVTDFTGFDGTASSVVVPQFSSPCTT